jgi:hypothetical protein
LLDTGSSLSKSEHTVVDLGHGGAPRLVSEIIVKSTTITVLRIAALQYELF